jgi:hypothetical protein
MTAPRRSHAIIPLVLSAICFAAPAHALDVTFDNGTGGVLTIVDNGAGDLNAAIGTIDFAPAAVGGTFLPAGRVFEYTGGPVNYIILTGAGVSSGTFQNVGGIAGSFTVTFESTPFAPIGPFVRYRLGYNGSADDPTPGDVEIPSHQITGYLNGTSVFLASIVGPPIPLTPPGGQPVAFGPITSDGDVPATATTITGVFEFTPGPGDQISLPSSFEITLSPGSASEVPASSKLGLLIILVGITAVGAFFLLRRRSKTEA